jgi:23S rRNA pseudouridine1911/1915/1917 synthase
MVVAKSDMAMAHLANQFHKKTNTRRYVALVWGDLKEDSGTIDKPMGRDPNDKKKMKAFGPYDGIGKPSVTHYEVIERFGYTTLVGLKLETGRTHQIRVHMASIGHPVFNDERYGGNHIVKGTIFGKYKQFVENCFKLCPRQALHAKLLGIEHPMNKEWMEFDSVIPDDMQAVITKWRDYSKGRLNNNTFESEDED